MYILVYYISKELSMKNLSVFLKKEDYKFFLINYLFVFKSVLSFLCYDKNKA